MPSVRDVVEAVRELYVPDEDSTFVVTRRSATRAVASQIGAEWSPYLGRMVRAAVTALGGRPRVVRLKVYTHLRPRAVDRDAYLAFSRAWRLAQKADKPLSEELEAAALEEVSR